MTKNTDPIPRFKRGTTYRSFGDHQGHGGLRAQGKIAGWDMLRCQGCGGEVAIVVVGLAEIAERLNVKRDTVDQWRARDLLPEPNWEVGGRPAWAWEVIEYWAKQTGRIE